MQQDGEKSSGKMQKSLDSAENAWYNDCAIKNITVPETVMIVIDHTNPTPIYEQVKTQMLAMKLFPLSHTTQKKRNLPKESRKNTNRASLRFL